MHHTQTHIRIGVISQWNEQFNGPHVVQVSVCNCNRFQDFRITLIGQHPCKCMETVFRKCSFRHSQLPKDIRPQCSLFCVGTIAQPLRFGQNLLRCSEMENNHRFPGSVLILFDQGKPN